MSDERSTDELLMRYFDGDLSEAEAANVAARLESDADMRAKHAALSNLNKAIGANTAQVSADVDFDALYARIETGIAADAQQTAPAADAERAPAPGLFERLGQFLGGLVEAPGQLWVPAAGLAAATAVALVVSQSGTPSGGDQRSAPGGDETAKLPEPPPARDNSDIPPPPPPVALASSEVVQVDFGDNTGTVFEIALAEGVSTPVVWINDEE